jgi:signal transduction histidine kinase
MGVFVRSPGVGDDSFFRDTFVYTGSREAVRAFLLFGFLLAVLIGAASHLAFRELSVKVLADRIDVGAAEARHIAALVEDVGADGHGIDFSLVRAADRELVAHIRARLHDRYFIHHVEVIDRFGIRQLSVSNPAAHQVRGVPDLSVPEDWPQHGEQTVNWPLVRAEGVVRLAVAPQPILDELARVRSSLKAKVAVAAALALAVLVAGFFYVLHLLRKNRRLEHARQSAARASYVGLLASGLAHEIRNPLNAMSMNLQMLEEEMVGIPGVENEEFSELLESNKSEIKRLESLVNNFLAYARPTQPRFESKDLNLVAREVLRFLEIDFRQSGVELRTDFEPLLPDVEIDETQFKQALLNLLVNARQVLTEGGVVSVRTRAGARGDVVLEVEDDGPGIGEDMRERIFEVFYSSRGGGTGLGLPIARQIVERHGGVIELETKLGHGTKFSIRLPRHHAPSAPERSVPEASR